MTEFDLDFEPGPERDMGEEERALAADMYEAVMKASRYSERSLQSLAYQAGVSDLGFCSERLRRMLAREVPDDVDELPAFYGTALGDHIEQAAMALWPNAVRQAEVTVVLEGEGGRTYNVVGHPDLIVDNRLIDIKTSRGLTLPRRMGPSQSQQFQRHCYAYGAWQGGLFGNIHLDEIEVANIWFDRAADEREAYAQIEPFDMSQVLMAAQWLDEVVYAYVNGTEARKEPPREMCAKVCGFYRDCRMYDTDVEGLLTDDEVLLAIDMYQDGIALQRKGKMFQDQAKAALRGVQGSTGAFTLRWTHVNGGHVEFDRKGYERMDLKAIK